MFAVNCNENWIYCHTWFSMLRKSLYKTEWMKCYSFWYFTVSCFLCCIMMWVVINLYSSKDSWASLSLFFIHQSEDWSFPNQLLLLTYIRFFSDCDTTHNPCVAETLLVNLEIKHARGVLMLQLIGSRLSQSVIWYRLMAWPVELPHNK